MAEEQKVGDFEENYIQPEEEEAEEYVTEEAIIYDNGYVEVKEDQLIDGIKEEEEMEPEVEEEQVEEELVAEEEEEEVQEVEEYEEAGEAEEIGLLEEVEDSDEKEMVVDDNVRDDNSLADESGGDSINNESQVPSDNSSKTDIKPNFSEEISQEQLTNRNPHERVEMPAVCSSSASEIRCDDSELENLNRQPDSWAHFTGLKVKHFTQSELEAFKKPFEMGWRREVVLRGTVTNSGKKIGDVYYFSPDKKTKLRSYVEMGLYLKRHPDCQLEPEHFTFARQPIYQAPEEIIRYAQQRGGGHGQPQIHVADQTPCQSSNKTPVAPAVASGFMPRSASIRSTNSDSGTEDKYGLVSVAEGRAKRKRVAPTRFEDEDYSEQSPFKKKPKSDKPALSFPSAPSAQTPPVKVSHMKVALSNKTSLLANPTFPRKVHSHGQTILQLTPQPSQHLIVTGISQLSAIAAEERVKPAKQVVEKEPCTELITSQEKESNGLNQAQSETNQQQPSLPEQSGLASSPVLQVPLSSCSSSVTSSTSATKKTSNNNSAKVPVLRIKMGSFKPIKPKPADQDQRNVDKGCPEGDAQRNQSTQPTQPTAPCSIMCNGRKGQLPSLLCSRCLCLFHPECVPTGVNLPEAHQFLCPNCVQPTESESQQTSNTVLPVNGNATSDAEQMPKSEAISKPPTKISNPPTSVGTQRSRQFQPILPRPSHAAHHSNRPQSHSQMIQQFHQQQQRHYKQQRLEQMLQMNELEQFRKSSQMTCSAANVKLPAGTHLYRLPGQHLGLSKQEMGNRHLAQDAKDGRKNARKGVVHPFNRQVPVRPLPVVCHSSNSSATKTAPERVLFLQKRKKRYTDYLTKLNSGFRKLAPGFICLNEIMKHLSTRDLVRLTQVNRLFNQLASQPFLWRKIVLRGMKISDWQFLGRNIVELHSATEIDFEGIRCSPSLDLCETWRNFPAIVDYLKSVRRLKFGNIPTFVIEELLNAAETQNCYNSFSNLEVLIVKHLFEEDAKTSRCCLDFMEQFKYLSQLQYLHLECRHGFTGNEDTVRVLSEVFAALTNLRTLIIPCIKGLSADQFGFLTQLTNVERLEIGSCESWTTSNESSTKTVSDCDVEELSGAFERLSELRQLRNLKLTDVIIDQASKQLSLALQKLENLHVLSLDSVTISPDATETLDFLCETVKSKLLYMKEFHILTDDPHTNKCVFELIKKLSNLKRITWKVRAFVEDSGECFVPFLKEHNEESEMEDLTNPDDNLELMDVTTLNEILLAHLPNTHFKILPQ